MNWVSYLRSFHPAVYQEYLAALSAAESVPYGQRFEAGQAVMSRYAGLARSLAAAVPIPCKGVSGGL